MSSCNDGWWWISSWYVTTSPLHGKVRRVFNDHWFNLCCTHTMLLVCMLVSLIGSSIHERCMFICPFFCEHILHVCSCVHPRTHLCMIIHLQARLFPCIVYSPVGEPILLHLLPLFIPCVDVPCLFVYLCLQSLMTRWHQNHKPPSITWCTIISDATDQERWEGRNGGWRLRVMLMKTVQG